MKNKRGQVQAQPAAQPAAKPVAKPAAKPAAQPVAAQPAAAQPNMPPQQGGWFKWWMIVVGVLVLLGIVALWVLLP